MFSPRFASLLVFLSVLGSASITNASIIPLKHSASYRPLTLSTRLDGENRTIKIKEAFGPQCGIYLGFLGEGRLPGHLTPKTDEKNTFVSMGVWTPKDCYDKVFHDPKSVPAGPVEAEFKVEEIFSEDPDLLERFNKGELTVVFYFHEVHRGFMEPPLVSVNIGAQDFLDHEEKVIYKWKELTDSEYQALQRHWE